MDSVLSKYRMQLFAIGTIGVLAVHSNEYIEYQSWLKILMGYGGIGVYLFAFMSGIGLYYSMSKNTDKDKNNVIEFYKRRLMRVAIPYAVIAILWYGIKYIIFERDILGFLYEFSTLSFWLEHKGAWYVAMLVPLYLVYPWYYYLCRKTGHTRCCGVTIICVFLGIVACTYFNRNLYEHLQQVFNSIIIFLIGDRCGGKICAGEFKGWRIAIVMLIMFVVGMKTPIENIVAIEKLSRPFLGVGLTIISAYILELIKMKSIQNILSFIGKYSLEIYLTNIFLIQADTYFEWSNRINMVASNYIPVGVCMYVIIVVIGIFLSVLLGEFCRKIQMAENGKISRYQRRDKQ